MTHALNDFSAQVLVVDDEEGHADVMAEALRRLGHVCTLVHDLPTAKDELKHGQFDLVVTDLVMEQEDAGMIVLETARQTQPHARVIMVTAHGDVPRAKAALRNGAYDFIEKPLDLDIFRTLCTHAIEAVVQQAEIHDLRVQIRQDHEIKGIIGNSAPIRHVLTTIRQVAPSNIPVLITGESGTGKELVARALHELSRRDGKPFVPLNCAGLSESILEDELFGHVRGAFTGAEREREGRFEFADGGTLFLDEVGDMPLIMQAKLLRVLESGEVIRLGANKARHVDVRLISATNRHLSELVEKHAFREDLFFRIKGVEIHLPSLRERREDIPLLIHHYLEHYARQLERPMPQLTEDAQMALMSFDWPGNVRQLMNVLQNMIVVAGDQPLDRHHLPAELHQKGGQMDDVNFDATMSLDQLEKHAIRNALRIHHGNRELAARMLGIGERTLYRKLKEYGLK